MATGLNICNTYDCYKKINVQSGGCEVTLKTHNMEVKGHLISQGGPELQVSMDSKQRAERMVELQERRRSLQSLLSTRLAELKRVCLQEAELTGEVPHEYPLENCEKFPHVRRKAGLSRSSSKHNTRNEEEDIFQRKTKKTLFSGALRRHVDSEQHPSHKRTVHRGCHTDNTVKSESSSTSDSTNQDTEEVSDSLSPSHSRLVSESPDSRFSRKLSPVEIYYEIKTRRSSVASSASPSHTLPRSVSNLEGRSVPATPLLSRNGLTGVHIRSESSSGTAPVRQWSDNPEASQLAPSQSQDLPTSSGSHEPGGSQTRRSNSSETLLDRNATEEGGQRSRNFPYKSSEALLDSALKQAQRSSPDRQVNGHAEPGRVRVRSAAGGRGTNGGGGYNDILMDYVWGKQQKMQTQRQQRLQVQNAPKTRPWPEGSNAPPPPYRNGQSQQLILGPPAYSPLMLRGKPGEPRRVKVSRTKSCGPFVPLQQHQQESILLSAYTDAHTPNANGTHNQQTDHPHRPPHYPFESSAPTTPDDPTRGLHKALALEGLRDWYLRNALGQTGSGTKGKEGTQTQRRRTTSSLHGSHQHPPLKHQPQSFQGDTVYTQLPQSATFHGHPLHNRTMELSLFQETFSSKMQEVTLQETSTDRPTPGTLV